MSDERLSRMEDKLDVIVAGMTDIRISGAELAKTLEAHTANDDRELRDIKIRIGQGEEATTRIDGVIRSARSWITGAAFVASLVGVALWQVVAMALE